MADFHSKKVLGDSILRQPTTTLRILQAEYSSDLPIKPSVEPATLSQQNQGNG